MLELVSRSPEETRALAANLAAVAEPGDTVCLWGELGAGKTVFAKGFGLGLGVRDTISSPSFVLMGEYAGRLPLFHIDLYRLSSAQEVVDAGLLGDSLPLDRLDVRIDGGADEPRTIRMTGHGEPGERYLPAAEAARVRA